VVRVTTGSFALTQLNEPKTLDSFDGVLGIAFSAYILSYITLGSDQILALHKLHHAVPPEYDYTQLVWTSSEISSWTDGVWELRHAGQGRVDLHVSAGTRVRTGFLWWPTAALIVLLFLGPTPRAMDGPQLLCWPARLSKCFSVK
jgi:hypothetical protein